MPYDLCTVHGRGEPFEPSFLAISPNNRRPAIIGPDGAPISVFEPGAILQYLARKSGRFGADAPREQVAVSEWLFWQWADSGRWRGRPIISPLRAREDPLRDRSLYERGQSPVLRHERASGEPRGVRRLGPGLEAHGSSTFPLGEGPTSPRTKRRAKFCSARGRGSREAARGSCNGRGRRAYPGGGSPDAQRRCGREAEGGGLLNRYRVVKLYRGFESPPSPPTAPSKLLISKR